MKTFTQKERNDYWDKCVEKWKLTGLLDKLQPPLQDKITKVFENSVEDYVVKTDGKEPMSVLLMPLIRRTLQDKDFSVDNSSFFEKVELGRVENKKDYADNLDYQMFQMGALIEQTNRVLENQNFVVGKTGFQIYQDNDELVFYGDIEVVNK